MTRPRPAQSSTPRSCRKDLPLATKIKAADQFLVACRNSSAAAAAITVRRRLRLAATTANTQALQRWARQRDAMRRQLRLRPDATRLRNATPLSAALRAMKVRIETAMATKLKTMLKELAKIK